MICDLHIVTTGNGKPQTPPRSEIKANPDVLMERRADLKQLTESIDSIFRWTVVPTISSDTLGGICSTLSKLASFIVTLLRLFSSPCTSVENDWSFMQGCYPVRRAWRPVWLFRSAAEIMCMCRDPQRLSCKMLLLISDVAFFWHRK